MRSDIDSYDDIAFDVEDDSQVRFDFSSVNGAANNELKDDKFCGNAISDRTDSP